MLEGFALVATEVPAPFEPSRTRRPRRSAMLSAPQGPARRRRRRDTLRRAPRGRIGDIEPALRTVTSRSKPGFRLVPNLKPVSF